jgi:hypothetical protein
MGGKHRVRDDNELVNSSYHQGTPPPIQALLSQSIKATGKHQLNILSLYTANI